MSGVERHALARDSDWRNSANCITTDPEVFFAEQGDHRTSQLAKRICQACIVRADCLDDALDHPPEHGVRAGYTARELRDLRHSSGRDKDTGMQEKYEKARALRDGGLSLEQIARRLGYASHGGVRHLLDSQEQAS